MFLLIHLTIPLLNILDPQEMDIDAILERAETREAEDNGGAGEELLSQFKVTKVDFIYQWNSSCVRDSISPWTMWLISHSKILHIRIAIQN